jgi:subfamily B ATP-binding cassette protein MsbA
MASAHAFISELPQGYQTRIGDKGVRLSGGQKQRLFIARELFKQPDLLILDEATSALDSASERYIQDSIDQLKGKITVIIIAHRLSTIKNADVIYVLDKGKVVESGSYEELMDNTSSRFSEMVELQSF